MSEHETTQPRSAESRRVGLHGALAFVLAALLTGGLLGGWLGHASDPLIFLARADCGPTVGAETASSPAVTASYDFDHLYDQSRSDNLELASRIFSLKRLLEELRAKDVSASEFAAAALRRMSDDQIHSALDEFLSIRDIHLEEIENLRDFTSRLVELALEGTLVPVNDDEIDDGSGTVYFTTERDVDDPASVAQSVFSSAETTIYAIYEVEEGAGQSVLLKWIRIDPPQIIQFRRRTVRAGDGDYHSFGIHRPVALTPGRYQVTVYSGDETLEPLARGHYVVR